MANPNPTPDPKDPKAPVNPHLASADKSVDVSKRAGEEYVKFREREVKEAEDIAKASVDEMRDIQEMDKRSIDEQMEIRKDPALIEAPPAASIEAAAVNVRTAKKAELEAKIERDAVTELPYPASGTMEGTLAASGEEKPYMKHATTHPKATDVPSKAGSAPATAGPLSSKEVKKD